MTTEILIYVGGAYQLVWALTHFYFPKQYWLVRALLQVQYFGLKKANTLNVQLSSGNVSNQTISYILLIVFLTGFGLFLAPVIITKF